MKTFTIIAGVNGTGKSCLSGVLREERADLGCIIDVDKIAAENEYSSFRAGRTAVTKIRQLLSTGASLTQETTLSGQQSVNTLKIARYFKYYIRLFYIGLGSYEESLERIKNRVSKGGHDVDPATVIYRFKTRFESLKRILPYCNEGHFYDNENGYTKVAEYKNGELFVREGAVPQWIRDLEEKVL